MRCAGHRLGELVRVILQKLGQFRTGIEDRFAPFRSGLDRTKSLVVERHVLVPCQCRSTLIHAIGDL